MNSMPSGWFPNPSNLEEEVYWDGEQWSGEVRRIVSPASAPGEGVDPIESIDRNGLGESTLASEQSVQVEAGGEDTRPPDSRSSNKRRRVIWIAAILVAIIAGGAGTTGIVIQNHQTQEMAAAHKAALHKAAVKKAAAEAAERAKKSADATERQLRASTVTEVEASVKKMAEDDVNKKLIDGPVIDVSCNPVNGGSTDDLTDKTTAFDCFVSNKDNGDGTQNGYFFNATVNWTTGSYTYGLGKSN